MKKVIQTEKKIKQRMFKEDPLQSKKRKVERERKKAKERV